MKRIAALVLSLVAVSPAVHAADAIFNGSFQSGSSGWITNGAFYANSTYTVCRSCPGYAYLANADGSSGNNLQGYIKQTVTIPAGATNPQLTWWYRITTSDSTTVVKDVMNVSATDSTTGAFTLIHQGLTNTDASTSYRSYTYNMSNWVGKTFSLMFFATTDATGPTTFRVDDVSLTYTPGTTLPAAPTNLNVIGSTGSILLGWQDNATNESGYEIQRSTLGGSFGPLTTLGSNSTAYSDNVGTGNTMCYQVRATNGSGASNYAGPFCGTSLAAPSLSAPSNGATLSNTTVSLQWQSVTGANQYGIDAGTSCGGTQILNNVGTNQVSYSMTFTPGTYFWRVRSLNSTYPGVSNPSACRSFTISSTVNPPTAAFSYSPTNPKPGDTVTFTNTSTGSPTSWSWNFGDGGTSSQQNPSHVYTSNGNYTVSLTVANTAGSSSTSKSVSVVAGPVASFTYTPASPAPNQSVSFTDTSSGSPTSRSWSFGDGQTSTAQNPSHVFTPAGNYTVTLTVTNNAGSDTTTRQVTVSATVVRPTAAFSWTPQSPKPNQQVSFADGSSGGPASWQWAFGDGATSTAQSPNHTYASANTYHVTLTVANSAGSNAVTHDVIVAATGTAPVADFTFSPASPKTGDVVTFTDTSSGSPTTRAWNFGDNATATSASPTHSYNAAGTYTVSLTVSNAFGSNNTSKSITVTAISQTLAAEFTYAPQSPTTDTTVQFTDRSNGGPTSWSWDFGDQVTSSAHNPTHRFTATGTYRVRLTAGLGTARSSIDHIVTVGTVPAPFISITPQVIHANETIVFRGSASVNVDRWTWTFDNATTMTGQEVTYKFDTAGPHTVALSATNAFGSGGASVRLDVIGSTCSTCSISLNGRVLLPPGVPIKGNYTRHVYLTKEHELAMVAEIGADGSYHFDAAPGTYDIEAEVLYRITIAGVKPYASKRETLVLSANPTTHDITLDPPVVFVHGINSTVSRWSDWASLLTMRHPGTIVIGVDYQYSDKDPYPDIASRIKGQLDDVLNDLTPQLPSLRVIAHSKGGLVTRVLGGQYAAYRSAITDIIELGTPNQGTTCYLSGPPKLVSQSYHLTPDQVQNEVTSLDANGWIANGPQVHAIVGTATRSDTPIADQLFATCPSSCEASDGFVNALSASNIVYTHSGATSKKRLPVLTVPYSHIELGTAANEWLLDVVIGPYYYEGKSFATCGGELWTDSCQSTWCSAGRGYTDAGNCPPPRSAVHLTRISWKLPKFTAVEGGFFYGPPLTVTASYTDDAATCAPINGSFVSAGLAGFKIYRSLDNALVPINYTPELLGALPPTALTIDDVSPTVGVIYTVCAIYEGNTPQCAAPIAVGGSRTHPTHH